MHLLSHAIRMASKSAQRYGPLLNKTVIQRQPLSVGPIKNWKILGQQPIRTMSQTGQQSNDKKGKTSEPEKDKNEEYEVKFKQGVPVKEVMKKLTTLYGPVFIVCHISVSLISLGFFCSLVWLSVDLKQIIPDSVMVSLGEKQMSAVDGGGKFVVAYVAHKLIFPLRLATSAYVTKSVSPTVKVLTENLLKRFKK